MNENQGYGFIPLVPALIGAGALIVGGGAFLLGKKLAENEYYDCLQDMIKKGYSIEKARQTCSVPVKQPSSIEKMIMIPIAAMAAITILNSISKKE